MTTWRKEYRRLNKILKSLSPAQKQALNLYLMSGEGPLPEGSNLDAILRFLLTKETDEIKELVREAENREFERTAIPQTEEAMKTLHFSLKVTNNLDPKTLFIVSRDITDSESDKLILQEVNIDSGDYIPLSAEQVASSLHQYADVMVERQNELNHNDV